MRQWFTDLSQGLLTVLFLTISAASIADDSISYKDIYELTFEELLKLKVTVASLRDESSITAPGVITVISEQEIKQFGARTLVDVLDRVVNTQVLSSNFMPSGKLSVRAVNQTHVDNNTLFLINGRPLRDGLTGGFNGDLYKSFPLGVIDHIEIVRGPGSVLYGTNAFAGVVNVVTKKRADYVVEAELEVGSYGRTQAQLTTLNSGEDYSFTLGVNSTRTDGDTFGWQDEQEGKNSTGLIQDFDMGHTTTGLIASGEYKNFKFNLWYNDFVGDSARAIPDLPSEDLGIVREYFDLEYHHSFSENWQASINYSQIRDNQDWEIREGLENNADSKERLLEAIVKGVVSDKFNIVIGATRIKDTGKQDIGLAPFEAWRSSFYSQADYRFDNGIKIIGGFQWNKPEESDGDVSPRLGYIQQFNNLWTVKLLYGEAFRSPFGLELFLDAPALQGNAELEPEKIKTVDAQLIYQRQENILSVTLYRSKHTNVIARDTSFSPQKQVNAGEVTFKGIEFENRHQLTHRVRLLANASYQENEDINGMEDTTFAPAGMIKIGLNYFNKKGLSVGIFNSYFFDLPDLGDLKKAPNLNGKPENYNMLTANIRIDMGKIFGFGGSGRSILSLYLDNLLDEDVLSAHINHRTPASLAYTNNSIPNHWGRGGYLTATFRF